MSNWSDGYVTEIGYTYGYYTELNPLRATPALINQRLATNPIKTVCELGFGQGLSANLIAAAQANLEYWGTDFNPSHARFAQHLASLSGANLHLFDQSFEEFCARKDLPDFDFISLHGIWSWISDHNRDILIDFIKRKLKLGGVVYISYNTLPGWAQLMPLRHILTLPEQGGQGLVGRINNALDNFQRIADTKPSFLQSNPLVMDKFQHLKSANRQYIAHEFFNTDWKPFYFSDAHQLLSSAKLNYGGSSVYIQHINIFNLSQEQIGMLDGAESISYKETLRDYFTNTQFRKDYWTKGALHLTSTEFHERYLGLRMVLLSDKNNIPGKVKTAMGEFTLDEKIYRPILELFVAREILTVELIHQTTGISVPLLIEALTVLQGMDIICVAQNDADIALAKPQCDRLNRYLIDLRYAQQDINFLASPVTGGGIVVPVISRHLISAYLNNVRSEEDLIDSVRSLLTQRSQRLTHSEGRVMSEEEQEIELKKLANQFIHQDLPRYIRLGIV